MAASRRRKGGRKKQPVSTTLTVQSHYLANWKAPVEKWWFGFSFPPLNIISSNLPTASQIPLIIKLSTFFQTQKWQKIARVIGYERNQQKLFTLASYVTECINSLGTSKTVLFFFTFLLSFFLNCLLFLSWFEVKEKWRRFPTTDFSFKSLFHRRPKTCKCLMKARSTVLLHKYSSLGSQPLKHRAELMNAAFLVS